MLLISCLECDHEVSVEGALETALRQKLSLAPDAPEPDFVQALRREKHRLTCGECRRRGAEIVAERYCAVCRAAIPRQRLAAMPNATQCVDCQDVAESSADQARNEDLGSCPKCGSPLKTYQKRAGATSYFVGCSSYPECRYKPRA